MGTKLLGHADVKVDGTIYRTAPGAKMDIGGPVREARKGNIEVYGYTESVKEATLECEIFVDKETSLADIRDITNASVSFEADTGQTWLITGAWVAEPPTVTDNEGGKVSVKFAGPPAQETK